MKFTYIFFLSPPIEYSTMAWRLKICESYFYYIALHCPIKLLSCWLCCYLSYPPGNLQTFLSSLCHEKLIVELFYYFLLLHDADSWVNYPSYLVCTPIIDVFIQRHLLVKSSRIPICPIMLPDVLTLELQNKFFTRWKISLPRAFICGF